MSVAHGAEGFEDSGDVGGFGAEEAFGENFNRVENHPIHEFLIQHLMIPIISSVKMVDVYVPESWWSV